MRRAIPLFLLLLSFQILGFSQPEVSHPYQHISGAYSELNRPEGVEFSPDGKFFAIANAEGESIIFYSVDDPSTPVFVLSGSETKINYPHDVSFSPNGKWLAVANRTGNSVTIYERSGEGCQFQSTPTAILSNHRFSGVGSVCFSPTDPLIAIASTYSNRIFFYSFDEGVIRKKPFQVIQHPSINIADGLSFSPDGTLLALTSHGNHTVQIFQKFDENKNIGFSPEPLFILNRERSGLVYPHSVTFDRKGAHLIVSSAGGTDAASVFEIRRNPFSIKTPALCTFNIFDAETHCSLQGINNEECGGKGVAISPDGEILLLCAPNAVGEDGVYFFRITP